jgi:hypothetical protein
VDGFAGDTAIDQITDGVLGQSHGRVGPVEVFGAPVGDLEDLAINSILRALFA